MARPPVPRFTLLEVLVVGAIACLGVSAFL